MSDYAIVSQANLAITPEFFFLYAPGSMHVCVYMDVYTDMSVCVVSGFTSSESGYSLEVSCPFSPGFVFL